MMTASRKALLRSFCRSRLFHWSVRAIEALPPSRLPLLRVLTYHRVDELSSRPDLDPSLISATPVQFEGQIQSLARTHQFVSLQDVLRASEGRQQLPPNALLLTFDDAYSDFAEHAWPCLQRHGVPATLFVPTGFPDRPDQAFWWDRLHLAIQSCSRSTLETRWGAVSWNDSSSQWAVFRTLKRRLKSLPDSEMLQEVAQICGQCRAALPAPVVLGWDKLRALAKDGVALVPHTHSHPLLNRISLEQATAEIRRSREELNRQVGTSLPAFAYPSGHYSRQVVDALRDEGFQLAFTTVRGINDLRSADLLRLRRSNVGRQSPEDLIRIQLTSAARYVNLPLPETFPQRRTQTPSAAAPLASVGADAPRD